MTVKMRSIGTFVFHEKIARPGDILEGTTSEYEWLRGADCVVKIVDMQPLVEVQMVDTENRTERRDGKKSQQRRRIS